VLFGSAAGIGAEGNQLWHQDRNGVPEQAEADDRFGMDLLARDLGWSGHADLAVQAISESVGTVASAGAANVLYGASRGLRSRRSHLWHQDRNRIRQEAESGGRLGTPHPVPGLRIPALGPDIRAGSRRSGFPLTTSSGRHRLGRWR
jgi:hypothetical protein